MTGSGNAFTAQNDREMLLLLHEDLKQIDAKLNELGVLVQQQLPKIERRLQQLETFRAVVLALAGVFWPLALVGAHTVARLFWH